MFLNAALAVWEGCGGLSKESFSGLVEVIDETLMFVRCCPESLMLLPCAGWLFVQVEICDLGRDH